MSNQPEWELVANLGDENPIEYGGYFVYRDKTGVYAEEAELLISPEEHERSQRWTVYRFILEHCTYVNGILSDNKFHPEHAAWFAKPESRRAERPQDTTYLLNVAEFAGRTVEELIEDFCSEDPVRRAWAYRDVGLYHGFCTLDDYPLELTRREVVKRYREKNA